MAQLPSDAFFIGTSNITLPVPNKQAFPEAFRSGSRLSYYASLFNSLEVNSSFYKIPMQKTVARWVGETPPEFRFTFKLFRELTHGTGPLPDPALVTRFMDAIRAADAKAGSLLIQFPPGTAYSPAYLGRLLALIRKESGSWDICVEFRHPSWYAGDVFRLLETFNAAIVQHDKRGAPPADSGWEGDLCFFRFHGPKGDYRGTYEFETLEQHAAAIRSRLQEGKRVYTYFNNTAGTAVFDALTMQELVTGKVTFEP